MDYEFLWFDLKRILARFAHQEEFAKNKQDNFHNTTKMFTLEEILTIMSEREIFEVELIRKAKGREDIFNKDFKMKQLDLEMEKIKHKGE